MPKLASDWKFGTMGTIDLKKKKITKKRLCKLKTCPILLPRRETQIKEVYM
jgi:hypothetical protein